MRLKNIGIQKTDYVKLAGAERVKPLFNICHQVQFQINLLNRF